jgi:3',5'-cyclic-nucleotide phosphodiesterase
MMTRLYILAGPDKDESFELKGDFNYIGRSPHNDIRMRDIAVSRRHAKISRRVKSFFIKDLGSENGTFVSGERISPGVEVEIRKGVPVVIGMSVICLGSKCLELVTPFLESIGLSNEIREDSGVFKQHKTMAMQKIVELVYRVSYRLTEEVHVNVMLGNVLDCIFDFLIKIDRGFIILIDSKTGEFSNVISRFREPSEDLPAVFNRDVVNRVIREGKGVIFPDPDVEDTEDIEETLNLSEIRSVLCVPIVYGSRITGAIYVDSIKETCEFRREDLSLFTDLGRRTGLGVDTAMLLADA